MTSATTATVSSELYIACYTRVFGVSEEEVEVEVEAEGEGEVRAIEEEGAREEKNLNKPRWLKREVSFK